MTFFAARTQSENPVTDRVLSAYKYNYAFSVCDISIKRGLQIHHRKVAMDFIFLVCTIGGLTVGSLVTLTLLLIALGKIEV